MWTDRHINLTGLLTDLILYIQNVRGMVRLENLVSSEHICTVPPPTKGKQWNRMKWRESGKVINLDRE